MQGSSASAVESIERATIAAVAPPQVQELGGWLLPFDHGTVGRARSAVPITHSEPDPRLIPEIESRYAAHDLPAQFRVPDVESFRAFRVALVARGYTESRPTLVQTAESAQTARCSLSPQASVQIDAFADDAWAAVFLGEGFDPVDGASRVATLRRAEGSLFASIRHEGRAVAAGVLALGHGWASVHGMRTAATHRRRGFALQVLTALAALATERGYESMVLQVEGGNVAAQGLYAHCGFRTAWRYSYWEIPRVGASV
ncbi:MAG: GNAT family N-acetyltransferase [Ramlibacter sp.]|nr:GNAT family N-acetyltransferase [Ramlibacter sp.]